MRRQLIPRLTANVEQKAVVYERRKQGSNQGETRDGKHTGERRRSVGNLKTSEKTEIAAKRAHSIGVLNTKGDPTQASNRSNIPFYTGSITRRTPVKMKVNQTHVPKQAEKRSPQDRVNISRSYERTFQYDKKPIQEKIPSTRSSVESRTKNKKESDYVSVKALIKQWSVPEKRKDQQDQPVHAGKYKNRRSLPAKFDASDVSYERRQLPHSKSVEENISYERKKDYMTKPNRSLEALSPSERNRESRGTKQTYVLENRQRRKSEPSNFSKRECEPKLIEKDKSSLMKSIDVNNDHYPKDQVKESVVEKSRTTKDMYAVPHLRQTDGKKIKGNYLERPLTKRISLPVCQKAEVKHVENYMDQKFIQRRDLQSIGKYATMPARQTRQNNEQITTAKKERGVEKIGDVNWEKMNQKANETSERTIEHPPRRSSTQKTSSSQRRLPSYKEALMPLEDADKADASKPSQSDKKKPKETEYVSMSQLHQRRARDNKGKSSTVTAREVDYSKGKRENSFKQHVTRVHAADIDRPILTSKDMQTNRSYEITQKRRNSHEKSATGKQIASLTNTSTGMSDIDARKSSSKKTVERSENKVNVKDENNNQLPVYDEVALETLLTSSQQMGDRDDSSKKGTNSERGSFVSQETISENDSQVLLNEYECLREKHKSSNARGVQYMNPKVTQPSTDQGGSNTPNVVHDRALLKLVAAEEKYWKDKAEKRDMDAKKENFRKEKEAKKVGNGKQERVNEMLREFKMHDQAERIDYSEITDTLRAEEEFLAQEAEKYLKRRFQEKSSAKPKLQQDVNQKLNESQKCKIPVRANPSGLHSILKTRPKKSPSVTSSDDINLKPEADQAYHHPKRILRSRSPVYICSGCRLPVEKDICLYVAELQSYWHEKCFCCSVCRCNLIQNEQTPKIRVMFSRIHCENCLSNKKTGGQSTMV
ncbi:sciellin-like isoform X2 [Dendronephthya gigantea]|nr:sciellin-like isoform X2 [Dendronephthya gigantea]XP_028406700.1 sciellin-like isoform X2 [Dendronephthya gigantea]XP_028406709.1 sciellin-like isoform X2 [Dendronephthya gigantea]